MSVVPTSVLTRTSDLSIVQIKKQSGHTSKIPRSNRRASASPGCRAANLLLAPLANYRESNASRLRQELKGMPITGYVKNGTRSKSSSPTKRSANSSPTHSLSTHSEMLPKKRYSAKTIDLISTPSTMSDASYCSKDGYPNLKVTANSPRGIVDTRSKTLHTLKLPRSEKDQKFMRKNIAPASNTTVGSTSSSGYGKPLVTPMNKKLTVRRNFDLSPRPPKCNVNKSPTPADTTSLNSTCKANSKLPINASSYKCADISTKPRLLSKFRVGTIISVIIHIIIFRLARITSYLFVEMWPCAIALIALAIVCWTATKKTNSANSLKSNIPVSTKRDNTTVGAKEKGFGQHQNPAPVTVNRINKSPIKQMHSMENNGTKSSPNCNKAKLKTDQQSNKPVLGPASNIPPLRSSATKIPKKISSDNSIKGPSPSRNNSTEKLKQQFCRDTPLYAAGRPNSLHGNFKSFKPQLEDIKSSYLLLNKHQQEQENKLRAVPDNESTTSESKREIIDENERKRRLNEIKNKFRSKKFFNNSKYEKIEGLNWISWKY